jgi:hypothetical protein
MKKKDEKDRRMNNDGGKNKRGDEGNIRSKWRQEVTKEA